MPSIDSVVTSLGNVRSHTRRVAHEIADRWTLYFIWGIGSSGEHAEGRALDFMGMELGGGVSRPGRMRKRVCDEIADYLWNNRRRLGVWYVIWNRRIISMTYESQGWRPYNGSSPHTDHVHVSFYNGATYAPPDSKHDQEDELPSPKDVWDERVDNVRLDDQLNRVDQGRKTASWMLTDIEATVDYVRRQVRSLDAKVDRMAEDVWENHGIINTNATGPNGGEASARWFLQNLERVQDVHGKRLTALEAGIRALAAGINETTANAVNTALAATQEGTGR